MAEQPEECVCAAIKTPDGSIFKGERHDVCFMAMRMDAVDHGGSVQGFVTNTGRFIDRYEGMRIQQASGKPSHFRSDGKYIGDILFSEDLY